MKIVPPTDEGIAEALHILRNGGVIAHATETCYGLACDLTNVEAVQKLFAMKKRPTNMPVSALCASVEQAQIYVQWNEEASQLASAHLPGPLTLILKTRPEHTLFVTPSGATSIGIRISSHPTAQKLVEQFGSPLSTTSANVHGQPNPYSVDDITKQYAGEDVVPDIVIDGGPLEVNDASTVVDVSEGMLHVLRKGNISL